MQWGDRVNGDRAIEFEEISGYHLEQAHRYLIELGLATSTPLRSEPKRESGSRRRAGGLSFAAT